LQQIIQRLEIERDHYRKEYNCRNEQHRTSDKDNVNIKSEKIHVQKIIILLFVINYRLICGHEFVN